ncbi:hypothetical protein FB45DRAFT_887136 [Roridomyces roridus]|uniref:Uncharacterized protein n=1 Tax=Roridomyces roridus TaxID=1738132 RepID=A0AAD7CJ28_9AGAR|nr:hypothetical protein FB45DRAFT_887136 [Roridomyces roridus]
MTDHTLITPRQVADRLQPATARQVIIWDNACFEWPASPPSHSSLLEDKILGVPLLLKSIPRVPRTGGLHSRSDAALMENFEAFIVSTAEPGLPIDRTIRTLMRDGKDTKAMHSMSAILAHRRECIFAVYLFLRISGLLTMTHTFKSGSLLIPEALLQTVVHASKEDYTLLCDTYTLAAFDNVLRLDRTVGNDEIGFRGSRFLESLRWLATAWKQAGQPPIDFQLLRVCACIKTIKPAILEALIALRSRATLPVSISNMDFTASLAVTPIP